MAKRFTDSRKWQNPWFRKLPCPYREFWMYLLDTCNHIGIWHKDFDMAQFCLGYEIEEPKAKNWLGDRIIEIPDNKWFIPGFLKYQYGELSKEGRLHNKIIKDLVNSLPKDVFSAFVKISTGCQQGVNTLKDKDKVKDKDMDKVKEPEQRFNSELSETIHRTTKEMFK